VVVLLSPPRARISTSLTVLPRLRVLRRAALCCAHLIARAPHARLCARTAAIAT